MVAPEPDKTGLHILIKLSALVIILAGIHAAADIIVQLLLALFFAIVLNPLVTWFIRRGVNRPLAISIVVFAMLVVLTILVGVLAASMSEFIDMLPKYNKMLTQKVFELEKMQRLEEQQRARDPQLQVVTNKSIEIKGHTLQQLDSIISAKGQTAYSSVILGKVDNQLLTMQITLPADNQQLAQTAAENIINTITIK